MSRLDLKSGRRLETTPERSRLMRAVRQSGTNPELVVRRLLTAMGVRYRLNSRSLPGRPDIANQRRRFVIFVHGCYWHHHEGCKLASTPTRNREFWLAKFAENRARDATNVRALRDQGYAVLTLWQCEVEKVETCQHILDQFFREHSLLET